MSRFDRKDRERIESQLIEKGRHQFARFGFERTRVKDVTDATGIGTGTFYQFFDSKEALYLEVLRAERNALVERLGEALSTATSQREEVRMLLEILFLAVRSNSLAARLILEDELRIFYEEHPELNCQSIRTETHEDISVYIEKWTENPEFRYDDPEVVKGIFRPLVFTTRSRELPLEEVLDIEYEEAEQRLIETIVDGLFAASSTP